MPVPTASPTSSRSSQLRTASPPQLLIWLPLFTTAVILLVCMWLLPELPAWPLHHTAGASGSHSDQPHTHMQLHPALNNVDRSC